MKNFIYGVLNRNRRRAFKYISVAQSNARKYRIKYRNFFLIYYRIFTL